METDEVPELPKEKTVPKEEKRLEEKRSEQFSHRKTNNMGLKSTQHHTAATFGRETPCIYRTTDTLTPMFLSYYYASAILYLSVC